MKLRNIGIVMITTPTLMLGTTLALFLGSSVIDSFGLLGTPQTEEVSFDFFSKTDYEIASLVKDITGQMSMWFAIATAIFVLLGVWFIRNSGKKEIVISVSQLFSTTWKETKKHVWLFVKVLLFLMAVNMVLSVPDVISAGNVFLGLFMDMVSAGVQIYLELGVVGIGLMIAQGKKPVFNDVFNGFQLFVKYAVAGILYSVVVGFGLVLFIVPGIYLGMKYLLWPFYLIDKKCGIIESFTLSEQATRGAKMDVWFVCFLLKLLIIVSILPLGLGLFVSLPFSLIALACVYRDLSHAK